ncbi:hypothetical protein pb186bvf_006450 [Paramecium bursaria]
MVVPFQLASCSELDSEQNCDIDKDFQYNDPEQNSCPQKCNLLIIKYSNQYHNSIIRYFINKDFLDKIEEKKLFFTQRSLDQLF